MAFTIFPKALSWPMVVFEHTIFISNLGPVYRAQAASVIKCFQLHQTDQAHPINFEFYFSFK